MIRLIRNGVYLAGFGLLILIALAGCTSSTSEKKEKQGKDQSKHKHDADERGPHGGPLAEWDDYHAEFTADHAAKQAIVYLLDEEAKKAPQVEASRFTKVKLTITSVKPPVIIELTHDAKRSGPGGIVFTGSHDELAKTTGFEGNLSGLRDEKTDGQKPYSGNIKYEGAKEKKFSKLALEPGGIYTAADIKANGNRTPAEKYQGREFEHSEDPAKAGEKFCPVSKSKANPDCTWIVQNQRYEFCCTPCINDFLRWAHNNPAKVKNANDYVK